jgi:signal transduction histidine kinase/CheY-like chemotaxis protein
VVLSFALSGALLIAVQVAGVGSVLTSWFGELQQADRDQHVRGIEAGVAIELEQLERVTQDWATWDATAAFVRGESPSFVEENLDDAALERLGVDGLFVLAASGETLVAAPSGGTPRELILRLASFDAPSGVLSDGHPWVFSCAEVFDSAHTTPAGGRLCMVRRFHERVLPHLQAAALSLLVIDASAPSQKGPSFGGEAVFHDPDGQLAFRVAFADPVPLIQQAQRSICVLTAMVVVSALVALLSGLLFVEVWVVRPLRELMLHLEEEAGSSLVPPLQGASPEFRRLGEAIALSHRTALALEQANRARQVAEQTARARSAFFARLSHEIRTPLNGVLGMAELLTTTPLSGEQVGLLSTLRGSVLALLGLVNEVLDLSTLGAGQPALHPRWFRPAEMAAEVVELTRGLLRESSVRVDLLDRTTAGLTVHGDADRLRQILVNLMNNASKFVTAGSIQLEFESDEATADIELRFRVRDTGPGLPPDVLDRLFEPFVPSRAGVGQPAGAGLGLAICKELVGLLHGEIRVESVPGCGATFEVTLRMPGRIASDEIVEREAAEPTPKKALFDLIAFESLAANRSRPTPESPGRLRVLVVEDNAVNLLVAVGMLQVCECAVDTCGDGETALQRMAEEDYDIVLMDCGMPVLDGLEATRRHRAWERQAGRAPVPIVALTAGALDADREACVAAGMDAFLGKPYTLDALREMLGAWRSVAARA